MTTATKTKATKTTTVNAKTIEAAIEKVRRTGKTFDNLVQTTGLQIIEHVGKHHDVSLVNRLIDAMPKGSRVNALRAWFDAFCKVTWNEKENKFDHDRTKETKLEEAKQNPWVEFKPEPTFKPVDLQADLIRLIERATKAAESGDERHSIDEELLSKLNSMVAA